MQEEEDVSNGLLSVATKPSKTGRSEMDPPTHYSCQGLRLGWREPNKASLHHWVNLDNVIHFSTYFHKNLLDA